MATEISDDSLPSAQDVANAFVMQYYVVLHKSPKDAHKFYKDTSVMGRPGASGTVKLVTSMKGIDDEIMSFDYTECTSKIEIVHAQDSLDKAVVVGVTGSLTGQDKVTKKFTQTFLLAPQVNGGFYVMNDFLFYIDIERKVLSADLSVDDVAENAKTPAPLLQQPVKSSETADVVETKEVTDEFPKVSVQSDIKSAVAKNGATTKPLATSSKNNNVVPVTKPGANFQTDPPKQSYASMLAKESETPTPVPAKVVRVNPDQHSSASSAPKPSVPLTKVLAPTSNAAPGTNNSPADAKAIHIRGLPYEIKDEELIESFKKFGPVKSHTIRIKRFEDGFCYAFLEFESSKSARSAVEARTAYFRGKEAQIQYKKSSNQAGNNRGRSPPARGGYYNDNSRGWENFGEGRRGGRYESGQAFGSPTGRNENYRDQPRGSSRGRNENFRDQARGSSAGRNDESYQKRGYQNGGERGFRRSGGN